MKGGAESGENLFGRHFGTEAENKSDNGLTATCSSVLKSLGSMFFIEDVALVEEKRYNGFITTTNCVSKGHGSIKSDVGTFVQDERDNVIVAISGSVLKSLASMFVGDFRMGD